jgi:hypothetical protein
MSISMSRKNRRYGGKVWKDGRDPEGDARRREEWSKRFFSSEEVRLAFPKIFSQEDRYRGKPLIEAVLTKEQEQVMKDIYERELNALLGIDKPKEEE